MLLVRNRKALYNNVLLEKLVAGIVLKGYEVKAIREGKASFEGSYITMRENKAFVVNMHISRYSKQSQDVSDEEATRQRQLLLTKDELNKLERELRQKGKTAVPLALILEHNLIKLELAIVKGRKEFEKKHLEKERQIQKDLKSNIWG
ncbi:MAG: SsrA-binding protein SmpB [Patescibacteria group bacterium]|jgi:SsrA-binding protein